MNSNGPEKMMNQLHQYVAEQEHTHEQKKASVGMIRKRLTLFCEEQQMEQRLAWNYLYAQFHEKHKINLPVEFFKFKRSTFIPKKNKKGVTSTIRFIEKNPGDKLQRDTIQKLYQVACECFPLSPEALKSL